MPHASRAARLCHAFPHQADVWALEAFHLPALQPPAFGVPGLGQHLDLKWPVLKLLVSSGSPNSMRVSRLLFKEPSLGEQYVFCCHPGTYKDVSPWVKLSSQRYVVRACESLAGHSPNPMPCHSTLSTKEPG